MSFFHPEKNSIQTNPLYVSDFTKFNRVYNGGTFTEPPKLELSRFRGKISQTTETRVKELVETIMATESGKEKTMYDDMCAILTSISLDVCGNGNAPEVLAFVPNFKNRLQVMDSAEDKPDLVAFLTSREKAKPISEGTIDPESINIPPAHALVAPVELKVRQDPIVQCLRYMFAIARHRPESSLQYGLVANRQGFKLLEIGVDYKDMSNEVPWQNSDWINKLATCIKLIFDEVTAKRDIAIPERISKSFHEDEGVVLYIYKATVTNTTYNLLPIFYGRGNGRKPFVAIAVPASGDPGDPKIIRLFKYSWYAPVQFGREHTLLLKLVGVPGVVQIDDRLSRSSLEMHQRSRRKRSLLALKTVGYPLGSCSSVLEFLEAMYDLLEVLRYLVQEKGVLHRDVSWTNVLVRPEHAADVRMNIRSESTNEAIKHNYRFISDIFSDPDHLRGVRVALADFDHASDLNNSSEQELKDATGTPMFMAHDVLAPRRYGRPFGSELSEDLKQEAMEGPTSKYADSSEEAEWNAFYSNLEKIDFIKNADFKHGAVHDAESVFYLCVLFFNRMLRSSRRNDKVTEDQERERGAAFQALVSKGLDQPGSADQFDRAFDRSCDESFVEMLRAMNGYLEVPWFRVKSTGRGQRYEFHLHDFMQRLILKEVVKLRAGDPIAIEGKPRRVRIQTMNHNAYTSTSRGFSKVLGKHGRDDEESAMRTHLKLMSQADNLGRTVRVTRSNKHRSVFMTAHIDLLRYKKREKSWFVADAYN